jgi:hypothetical protein
MLESRIMPIVEHGQKARRKVYVPENARRNEGIVGRKQVDDEEIDAEAGHHELGDDLPGVTNPAAPPGRA